MKTNSVTAMSTTLVMVPQARRGRAWNSDI